MESTREPESSAGTNNALHTPHGWLRCDATCLREIVRSFMPQCRSLPSIIERSASGGRETTAAGRRRGDAVMSRARTDEAIGRCADMRERKQALAGDCADVFQSWRTTLSSELLILSGRSPSYSMKPSFLNLFRKKFTRDRVVPIISASVSCEIFGTMRTGLSFFP